jgi:hypothetical protein
LAFWAGYICIRMPRAAAATAASAEALGAMGIVSAKRAYRSWTVLTPSAMATCTIAMLRDHGLPATFAAFRTSIDVWFHSVTVSALAWPAIRARASAASR